MSNESQPRKQDVATQQIAREENEAMWSPGQVLSKEHTLKHILSAIERATEITLAEVCSMVSERNDRDVAAQPQPSKARKEQAPRAEGSPASGEQDNWNLKVGQALPHLPACKQGEACTCPYGYGENVIQATQPRREEQLNIRAMEYVPTTKFLELREQLLSALAAIEEKDKALRIASKLFATETNLCFGEITEALRVHVDRSALHEHDEEVGSKNWNEGYNEAMKVAAEVRKPLVEALEKLHSLIWNAGHIGHMRKIIDDALAKVKEGK